MKVIKFVGPDTSYGDVLGEKTYIEITNTVNMKEFGLWLDKLVSEFVLCRLTFLKSFISARIDQFPIFTLKADLGGVQLEYWVSGDKVFGKTIRMNITRIVKRAIRVRALHDELRTTKYKQEFEFETLVRNFLIEKLEDMGIPKTETIPEPDDGKVRRTGTVARRYVTYTDDGTCLMISNFQNLICIPKCKKNTIKNIRENRIYSRFMFLPKRNGRRKVRTWEEIAAAISFYRMQEKPFESHIT